MGKLLVLDFVSHWLPEEQTWRNPTNRMARAWAADTALVRVLVWEQERGANAKLARALPHPRVALDASGALGRWLQSHGTNALPLSLLFSRDGKLLFSGQPFELPEMREKIRAGKFSPEEHHAMQTRRDAEQPARRALVTRIGEREKAGKWREAISLIDTEGEKFVAENRAGLYVRRFKILHKNAPLTEAVAYADVLEKEPVASEFPWLLHDLALEVADKEKPSKAELTFGLALMERLVKRDPTRPSYWDTLAELRYESGDVHGALAAQNQAVRFLGNQLDLSDSERESILRWQANYRAETGGKRR